MDRLEHQAAQQATRKATPVRPCKALEANHCGPVGDESGLPEWVR